MPVYLVKASNSHGTYTAGRYYADTSGEAVEQAKEDYENSLAGRTLRDTGAFRFWAQECRTAEEEEC